MMRSIVLCSVFLSPRRRTLEPKLRETLLIKGDVNAVSGFATTIIPALEKAGKKPEDMNVFYYTDNGLDLYGNAIVVKKAFLEKNPEVVKGFLKAYFKGFQDTLKDPTAGLESGEKLETLVLILLWSIRCA